MNVLTQTTWSTFSREFCDAKYKTPVSASQLLSNVCLYREEMHCQWLFKYLCRGYKIRNVKQSHVTSISVRLAIMTNLHLKLRAISYVSVVQTIVIHVVNGWVMDYCGQCLCDADIGKRFYINSFDHSVCEADFELGILKESTHRYARHRIPIMSVSNLGDLCSSTPVMYCEGDSMEIVNFTISMVTVIFYRLK